jgi:hypothetical protein
MCADMDEAEEELGETRDEGQYTLSRRRSYASTDDRQSGVGHNERF